MKRLIGVLCVVAFMFLATPINFAYAGPADDNVLDKAGDWAATIGKQGVEKDQILATRKADRMKKRAEIEAKKAAKKAERDAKKAQKEASKSFGDAKKKLGF